MKNSNNGGFDQHFNAQIAVDQSSLLIVSTFLSNHPNDQLDGLPTVDAISPRIGKPKRAAFDTGYFSVTNIQGLESRNIEPYIATGRPTHYVEVQALLKHTQRPPEEEASAKVKMKYKLQTDIGKEIYRLRKCTVEPVFGIIKETMGFRQFSLRGLTKATGEWSLVCLAFNLRRLQRLILKKAISPTGC